MSFIKFFSEYNGYFNLSSTSNFNLKFKFGFGDETLPLSQQFDLGGQEDFFGFREYEYRGRQVLRASMGYRYKLPVNLFFPT